LPDPGGELAIHSLAVHGRHAYWREERADGNRILRSSDAAAALLPVARPADGLEVIGFHPGEGHGYAVVRGYPGGDYGQLSEPTAPDWAIARRPTLAWLSAGSPEDGACPGFIYTGFPEASSLKSPPVTGVQVLFHRVGQPFRADVRIPLPLGKEDLVTVEPATEPDTVVAVVSSSEGGTARWLVRLAGKDHDEFRCMRLNGTFGPRTGIGLGHGRWWRGEHLGTRRSVVYAQPPGCLDPSAGVPVELPETSSVAWLWATRHGLLLRLIMDRSERLAYVDNQSLELRRVAGGPRGTIFSEIAASPAADCAAWLRLDTGIETGRPAAYLEKLDHDGTSPAVLVHCQWPRRGSVKSDSYQTEDDVRLPVYLTGDTGPVLLLEHSGMSAVANSPLERSLEKLAFDGEFSLARAVTRSLGPARLTPDGRRGYNDLLAAAIHLRSTLGDQRPICILGHSMGAVGTARAVLLRPDLFSGCVLRFPVTDLVGFPALGIGAYWKRTLGDPAVVEQRDALMRLSPLHMALPRQALPPVLFQVGTYDTRAHPDHGRRLAARWSAATRVKVSEYPVGHVELLGAMTTAAAVAEVVAFIRDANHLSVNSR
jgi:pimeloyl-ACP methyl ester carboxylesterase